MKPTYFTMSCCGKHIATIFAETDGQLTGKVLLSICEHFSSTDVALSEPFEFYGVKSTEIIDFSCRIDGFLHSFTIQQTDMY